MASLHLPGKSPYRKLTHYPFTSDVFLGAVLGYGISRYVVFEP